MKIKTHGKSTENRKREEEISKDTKYESVLYSVR